MSKYMLAPVPEGETKLVTPFKKNKPSKQELEWREAEIEAGYTVPAEPVCETRNESRAKESTPETTDEPKKRKRYNTKARKESAPYVSGIQKTEEVKPVTHPGTIRTLEANFRRMLEWYKAGTAKEGAVLTMKRHWDAIETHDKSDSNYLRITELMNELGMNDG